jgi:folate-binding protein YgfZ
MKQNTTSFISPLPQWSIFQCHGKDATAFLQGQLTSNVETMSSGSIALTAHCSPKGRVRFIAYLYKASHDDYLFILPKTIKTHAIQALQQYIVFSKADLNETTPYHCLGSVQQTIDHAIAQLAINDQLCLAISQSNDHFEDQHQRWHAQWLQAAQPMIYPQTYEKFIAPRLNLHPLKAIALDKGCYIGQEIVARIHFLGQLKHHMVLGQTTDSTLSPGDTLYNKDEKVLAHVVDSAHADTHWISCVIKQDHDLETLYSSNKTSITLIKPDYL